MRDSGLVQEDMEPVAQACSTAGLAFEAIVRLVAKRSTGAARVQDQLVVELMDASHAADGAAVTRALAQMRRVGVGDEAIVTQYIPEAARRLGRAWEDDSLSFLQVTVGTARLGQAVEEIGCDWLNDEADRPGQASVLLLVPPGEQHILGVTVLACVMRQDDISICLRFAPSVQELATLLATRRFDGVMITLGSTERIESCAMMVKALHALGHGALRVAVGGSIVGNEPDLAERTGAELVSSDLGVVLAHFGLKMKQKT